MKTRLLLLVALAGILSSCEKYQAKQFIKEHLGYADTEIVELGELQDFPSPSLVLSSARLDKICRVNQGYEASSRAFLATSRQEAIKILSDVLDSLNTDFYGTKEASERAVIVASYPQVYLGQQDSLLVMRKARKVSYTTPEGYVKKDILVYDTDGSIFQLGADITAEGWSYVDACNDLWKVCDMIEDDIRAWKRGEYAPMKIR